MNVSHTNTGSNRPTNRGIKQPQKKTRNVTPSKADSNEKQKEAKAPTGAAIIALREDYNFLGEKQHFMPMQKDKRLKATIAAMTRLELGKMHRRLNKVIDHYSENEVALREKHADDVRWLKTLRAEIQTTRNNLRVVINRKAKAA